MFKLNQAKENQGELAIPEGFDTIEGAAGNYMLIKRNDFFAVINQYGEVVIEPKYEDIHHVGEDIFVVKSEDGFKVFKLEIVVLPANYETKESAIEAAKAYLTH